MKIGKNRATIKGAMALLDKVLEYYNSGYSARLIAEMTGLRLETVQALVDIAAAVEREATK